MYRPVMVSPSMAVRALCAVVATCITASCAQPTGGPSRTATVPVIAPDGVRYEPFASPGEVDRAAAAAFVIMSDHKGYSPHDSDEMERMVDWSREMGAAFTIGMGDHLKRGWTNLIFRHMAEDAAWRNRWYPNVADGENEYYGSGQDDWGAGGELLEDVGMYGRPGVTVRPNGAEYYARLPLADHTVHLIQLHFSDSPGNDSLAFRESSRAWLDSMLSVLPDSPRNIIVVGAHSRLGRWVHILQEDRRAHLLSRADLVMSATTHHFERFDHGQDSAFVFNTGAVNFGAGLPDGTRDNGFTTVHLLREPDRLLIQYVSLISETRSLAPQGRAFVRMLETDRIAPVAFPRR